MKRLAMPANLPLSATGAQRATRLTLAPTLRASATDAHLEGGR